MIFCRYVSIGLKNLVLGIFRKSFEKLSGLKSILHTYGKGDGLGAPPVFEEWILGAEEI